MRDARSAGTGKRRVVPPAARRRAALWSLAGGTVLTATATAVLITGTVPLAATGADGRPPAGGAPTSTVSSPAPTADGRTGPGPWRDPLTSAEIEGAQRLALAADAGLRTAGENVRRERGGPQYLGTDLAESPPSVGGAWERKVVVRFYDYGDDVLIHKTVDLLTQKVEGSRKIRGVQPPPIQEETEEAAVLLLGDRLGDGLRQDFARATGVALTRVEQLQVRGGTYRSYPLRGDQRGPLRACGTERCVQVYSRVPDGPRIDTSAYVINLSDRSVHRLRAKGGGLTS
ncbi:Tat pathway signal sequence domain protein [Streptomyces sp. CRN 30]|uniref:Tat pathway signal sequence domain protein n=1 Tax=Streptomyces sp. CRN 30 TaxID=3075613 RepID=UPI002A8101DD|nr:Tat pathway signal sequence domain protein [Streptomyces sp. CRN 30]